MGLLTDETSNHNDLILNSGSIYYLSRQGTDSFIVFNGASSVASINDFNNSSFSNLAICLWVKASTVTSELQIILQGANLGFGVYLEPNTGKLYVHFDGSSIGSNMSTSPITDGNWHYVVVQNNGNTSFMFIDGIFENSIAEDLMVGTGASDEKLFMG